MTSLNNTPDQVTGTANPDYTSYCSYRLPCGYCRLTESQCLAIPQTNINWNAPYCTSYTGLGGQGGAK